MSILGWLYQKLQTAHKRDEMLIYGVGSDRPSPVRSNKLDHIEEEGTTHFTITGVDNGYIVMSINYDHRADKRMRIARICTTGEDLMKEVAAVLVTKGLSK